MIFIFSICYWSSTLFLKLPQTLQIEAVDPLNIEERKKRIQGMLDDDKTDVIVKDFQTHVSKMELGFKVSKLLSFEKLNIL